MDAKGLNILEASKTKDTQAKAVYAEQHGELTDQTTVLETMQEQQTQVETQTVVKPHFLDTVPYLSDHVNVDKKLPLSRKESGKAVPQRKSC